VLTREWSEYGQQAYHKLESVWLICVSTRSAP